MKSCPYDNSIEYIVMYHDGVLPDDMAKAFSDHLITCQGCLDILLNLQNDLFSMRTREFEKMPEGLVQRGRGQAAVQRETSGRAVFRLLKHSLQMLGNLSYPTIFVPVEGVGKYQREGTDENSGCYGYRLESNGVDVEIQNEDENLFRIEVNGIRNRRLSLERDGHLIERRFDKVHNRLVIGGLERGGYRLAIDDEDFILFTVS
jgi:hypothetical protein